MNAPVENSAVDQTVLGQALARLEPVLGTANAIGDRAWHGPWRRGGGGAEPGRDSLFRHSRLSGEYGVSGHAGRLVVGEIEGRRVVVMQGRAHYYETTNAAAMRIPLEVMRSSACGRSS